MSTYAEFIQWLKAYLAWGDPAVHMHAGMVVFVLARALTRRPFRTFVPFAWVTFATVAHEALDRYLKGGWFWPDTLSDAGHTMFWPLALTVMAAITARRR